MFGLRGFGRNNVARLCDSFKWGYICSSLATTDERCLESEVKHEPLDFWADSFCPLPYEWSPPDIRNVVLSNSNMFNYLVDNIYFIL